MDLTEPKISLLKVLERKSNDRYKYLLPSLNNMTLKQILLSNDQAEIKRQRFFCRKM